MLSALCGFDPVLSHRSCISYGSHRFISILLATSILYISNLANGWELTICDPTNGPTKSTRDLISKLNSTSSGVKIQQHCLPFPTFLFFFSIKHHTYAHPIPRSKDPSSHGLQPRSQTHRPLSMRQSHLLHNLETALLKRLSLPRMPASIRLRIRPHPRRPIIRRPFITLIPTTHRSFPAQKRLRSHSWWYLLYRLWCTDLPQQPRVAAVDQYQGGHARSESGH